MKRSKKSAPTESTNEESLPPFISDEVQKKLVERLRKKEFIAALAEYLVGNQTMMSIRLEAGEQNAIMWSKVRHTTPLFGYPTIEEAKATLEAWLLS